MHRAFDMLSYWLNIHAEASPLAAAIKLQDWGMITNLLLGMKDDSALTGEVRSVLQSNRGTLVKELKLFMQDKPSEQLQYLDKVIARENALGIILSLPASPILFSLSWAAGLYDNKNRVTNSLEQIIGYRDALRGILIEGVEGAKPSQQITR